MSKKVKDKVLDTVEDTKDMVEDVVTDVKKGVRDASKKGKRTVRDTKDKVVDKVEDVVENVVEGTEKVSKRGKTEVSELLEDATKKIKCDCEDCDCESCFECDCDDCTCDGIHPKKVIRRIKDKTNQVVTKGKDIVDEMDVPGIVDKAKGVRTVDEAKEAYSELNETQKRTVGITGAVVGLIAGLATLKLIRRKK